MIKSHSSRQAESDRQRYIRLLARLERTPAVLHSRAEDSLIDLQTFIELLDHQFIEGCVVYDNLGNLTSIVGMSITARGRQSLDELRSRENAKGWGGFWHAHRLQVFASSLLIGAAVLLYSNW